MALALEKIKELVTYLEHDFWIEGEYPSLENAMNFSGTSEAELLEVIPTVDTILKSRGLPPVGFSPLGSKNAPSNSLPAKTEKAKIDPDFALAVDLLVDLRDSRSEAAKLKELKLTTKWFKAQMRNQANAEYYKKRVTMTFEEGDNAMKLSLVKLVSNGELNAIKYFNELTGTYRPNQETLLNLGILIGKMMEILARHVDPSVIDTVAEEIELILATEQIKQLSA